MNGVAIGACGFGFCETKGQTGVIAGEGAGEGEGAGLSSACEGDAGVRVYADEPPLVLRELPETWRGWPIGLEMSEPGRAGRRRRVSPQRELGASDAPDVREAEDRRGGVGWGGSSMGI